MELKYNHIVLGYKFESKCGYPLEVTRVYSPTIVEVTDNLGRVKVLTSSAIVSGRFKWTYTDGSFCANLGSRLARVSIGDIRDSNHYGKFEVISQEGKAYTIKFLNTGGLKHACSLKNVLVGNVCDNSAKRYCASRERFYKGLILDAKDGDKIEIVEYIIATNIICKWVNSGNTVVMNTEKLKNPQKLYEKLSKKSDLIKSYIYYVYHNNKVVYIGKGKGNRYKHPNTGSSSCRELNRLHFLGEVFDVKIIESGLTYEEAKIREKHHIRLHTNLFNSVYYTEQLELW